MKKTEIKKLDKLWRDWVYENFKGRCIIPRCPKKHLNVHHYVGRRNRATRWYKENACLICSGHHTFYTKSAHQDPEWFRQQMLDLWGDLWLKDLTQQSNKIFKGTYQQVEDYLTGKTNNYI